LAVAVGCGGDVLAVVVIVADGVVLVVESIVDVVEDVVLVVDGIVGIVEDVMLVVDGIVDIVGDVGLVEEDVDVLDVFEAVGLGIHHGKRGPDCEVVLGGPGSHAGREVSGDFVVVGRGGRPQGQPRQP